MAITVNVANIQNRIRFRCDIPTDTTNTNVSTADMLDLVQESARRISGILNNYSEEAYFTTTSTISTVANVPTVNLPGNFTYLLQIHWDKGNGEIVPLRRANIEDVKPSASTDPGWTSIVPLYRLVTTSSIEFFPTPRAVHSVAIRYSTGLFVNSASDNLSVQAGWDEWIVLDACIKVRQRQGKDASDFIYAKRELERELRQQARQRDRMGYSQPRDVRHDNLYDHQREWWRYL